MTEAIRFLVGQTVRVDVEFRDPVTRDLADPSGDVTLFIRPPSADPADDDDLIEVAMEREAEGEFFARFVPGEDGLFCFRASSEAPDVAVVEGDFTVDPSAVLA